MKATIEKISESKREITYEIPAEDVQKEFEKIVRDFSKRAKVRGFRPGKVPFDIIKNRYYLDIKDSLIRSLVPKVLDEELKSQDMYPIDSPILKDIEFDEGKPMRFKAEFEVWPDILLPDYKGIPVEKKDVSVTDEEVQKALRDLQEKSAQYIPVEGRGVQEGDYVMAEIQGRELNTKKFLPKEKVVILAGHKDNEKTVNEKIAGLNPEQEIQFVIDYKKDNPNKKLAGRSITYDLKVLSIKKKKIPQINDDLAKELGEYKNLVELKKDLGSRIKESKENVMKTEMAEEIVRKIAEKTAVEIPQSVLEREYMNVLKRILSNRSRSQTEIKKEEAEQLKAEARKIAEKRLKNHFILKEIAKKENLTVTDKNVDDEIREIAKTNNIPLAKVLDTIEKENQREDIRENLLVRKAVDFLLESAKIK